MDIANFRANASDVLLEVECAPSRQHAFEREYAARAGAPPAGPHYQIQSDKWGLECRIYFNAPPGLRGALAADGLHVEQRNGGYGSDRMYRVNSQDAFWELVDAGYRLGPN